MGEISALFLAGLALFFTGVAGVKARLQQLSGGKFRRMLAKVTDRPVLSALVGALFGAVTQSGAGVAFILSGMVATGLIPLRRALPVVAASNVGTALLVALAAFDLRVAVLFLIGTTGLMIAFRVGRRFEALIGALFSIGVLFLGLSMMKEAFAPMPKFAWFHSLAEFLKQWSLAPFLLGAVFRMFVQSSSAIGVIAITLQAAGLFTPLQAVMLMCGAGPGVALATFFLSTNLKGAPRQIVLYQGIINLLSGTTLAVIFALTESNGRSWLLEALDMVTGTQSDVLAMVFFASMAGCLIFGLLVLPWAEGFLAKMSPPTLEQDISRPAYLHEEALAVPDTALDLAEQEQQRFFGVVVKILETVREESRAKAAGAPLYAGASQLGGEVTGFLKELINRPVSPETAGNILLLERRQENLNSLLETINRYRKVREDTAFGEDLTALMDRLTESLHLILLTAVDAWRSGDQADRIYLDKLTSDRGAMMERLRRTYQGINGDGDKGQNAALFYETTLFERAVWLVRQVGMSLRAE